MIGDASMSTGRGGPEPPEKVTIPWLLKYVPIGLWLAAGSLLVATFIVGFGTSQIPGIYQFLGKADPRGQTTVGPRAHPAGRAEQVLSPIIPKLEGTSWTCTPARCLRGQNPKIDSALKLRDSAGHEFFGELNTGSPLTVQLYEFKNSSEGQSANIGDTFSGSRALKFTDEGGHQFYGEVGGEGPNIVTTYQMTNGYINRGAIVKGIINKDLTEIRWQVDDGNVWRKNVVP